MSLSNHATNKEILTDIYTYINIDGQNPSDIDKHLYIVFLIGDERLQLLWVVDYKTDNELDYLWLQSYINQLPVDKDH